MTNTKKKKNENIAADAKVMRKRFDDAKLNQNNKHQWHMHPLHNRMELKQNQNKQKQEKK